VRVVPCPPLHPLHHRFTSFLHCVPNDRRSHPSLLPIMPLLVLVHAICGCADDDEASGDEPPPAQKSVFDEPEV
jgi:hypothetical protein